MSDWGVFPLGIARGLAGSSCSHLAMQKHALRVTIRSETIVSGFSPEHFDIIRLRFQCTQILQIERPKSVLDCVADTNNSIFKAVSEQNDERASTAAQLRSTDRARAAWVESAVALHSIFHPRIGVPDTARQLLPAHPIR